MVVPLRAEIYKRELKCSTFPKLILPPGSFHGANVLVKEFKKIHI